MSGQSYDDLPAEWQGVARRVDACLDELSITYEVWHKHNADGTVTINNKLVIMIDSAPATLESKKGEGQYKTKGKDDE